MDGTKPWRQLPPGLCFACPFTSLFLFLSLFLMPQDAAIFTQEKNWVGIDTYHAPNKLAAGVLQQADNLFVVGGNLVTRPGIQGKLAAVMGGPIYELTPFLNADGTTTLVFA